jgi:hypothetical protein
LIQVYCKNNEHVDLGVQFQIGDSVSLINLTKEDIIAIGMISRIGGQTCFHHGTPIEDGWFRMQLIEIMEGKGFIPLLITNENDDPPQLMLKDVVGTNLVWKGQFLQKNK